MAAPPTRRPIVGSLAGLSSAQNISRRNCTRTVPMEILCFGLSRSGTSSLRQALLDLGYNEVYHFASVLNENPQDAELWLEALAVNREGRPFGKENWDALLGHCMAVTDTPVVIFWKELLETYPDAKVVLTVRDSPGQWFDSQMNTLMRYMKAVVFPAPSVWNSLCSWFLPAPRAVDELSKRISMECEMYQILLKDTQNGTREGEKFYERHLEEVQKAVPKERLLVTNVKEGWKPLCDFLEKEVPAWDFPRANFGDEFLQNMAAVGEFVGKTVRWNMAKTLIPVAAVAAVASAWWMRRPTV